MTIFNWCKQGLSSLWIMGSTYINNRNFIQYGYAFAVLVHQL